MTPQELKNSILQLAIQGKLVEQRPEEGTAEELYQQIQNEKQKHIKVGKMKKGKEFPQITDDDIPFEIPASWKWVRVTELGEVIGGGTPKTENTDYWDDNGMPWLTPADMKFIFGKYAERGQRNISALGLAKSSAQLMPKGTILYSSRAPIGYIAIAANDISTNQGFKSLIPATMDINEFMYYCLIARTRDIVSRASGTTFKEISGTDFGLTIVPLPPFAEQKRIVAKIEELLPYIDRYEQSWRKLEDFNKRFPTDMQKSILQTAIQGKLVEQRPEEGIGEELYRQIQGEKQKLIKDRIIKKEKSLPEIAEEEKLFEIPESWMWTKLGDISWFFDAGKSPKCEKNSVSSNEWGVIATTAIQNGFFDEIQNKILPANYEVKSNMQVKTGDILITRAGPTNRTGIACLVKDIHYNLILSDKTLRINMTDQYVCKDFIIIALNSPQIRQLIIGLMSGMDKQQVNISQDKYKTVSIPLPPIAEQKRIVAKMEEILPLCDKLKR